MDSSSTDHHHSHGDYSHGSHRHHRHHHNKSTTRRVNFLDGVWAGFANLFNFMGRMRRSEYWWFFIFSVVFAVVCYFGFLIWLDYGEQILVEKYTYVGKAKMFPYEYKSYSIPVYIFIVLLFSAQVRRFHDVGMRAWVPYAKFLVFVALAWHVYRVAHAARSFDFNIGIIGWSLLLAFIALAGVIAYVACKDSEKERNRWGRSPKYRRKLYEELPPPPDMSRKRKKP